MSLSNKEILAFVKKNIDLKEVDGKIGISLIKTDINRVNGYVGKVAEGVGLVLGHVDRAASVRWVEGHVDRASSVRLIEGHVDRAASASRVYGRVDKAGSVRWVSNEENES